MKGRSDSFRESVPGCGTSTKALRGTMLSVPDIRLSREISLADRKVIGNKVRAVASGQIPPGLAVHGFHSQW